MRRTIIGTGIVVVAIASLAWWRTRTEASPASTNPARAPATSTISSPRSPELPAGDAARSAREAPAAQPQVNRPEIQGRIADAHAHLQDAVKPCRTLVTTKASRDAQFQFSYQLAVSGREASISNVSLVWSDYTSAELETCLLEKLAAARWTSADADFTTTVEDALAAAELE